MPRTEDSAATACLSRPLCLGICLLQLLQQVPHECSWSPTSSPPRMHKSPTSSPFVGDLLQQLQLQDNEHVTVVPNRL
jgi:hypothetical protein